MPTTSVLAYYSTPATIYSNGALSFVANQDQQISDIAVVLGVGAGAIAGAMAEEHHVYLTRYPADLLLDAQVQDRLRSHTVVELGYDLAGGDSDAIPANTLAKYLWPVLSDVGPANVKIATAIGLIQRHANQHPELGLQQYLSRYDLIVEHLISGTNSLTSKIFGLMIKEAQEWYVSKSAYGSDWNALPQEFKDALYVTYVNFGRKEMEEKFVQWDGRPYEPMPGFGVAGGMDHLANAQELGTRLGIVGYGSGVGQLSDPAAFIAAAEEASASGMAYRYALLKLRPVVLFDLDYNARNQDGKLDLYDESTGAGALSTQWIADRAQMLDKWTEAVANGQQDGAKRYYADTGGVIYSGFDARERPVMVRPGGLFLGENQFISFGNDADNTYVGGALDDRFYGGVGTDILSGAAGADRLEGGEGTDRLFGGEGGDTLIGGRGEDTLDGGLGNDVYIWNEGDGADQILDAREGVDDVKLGTIQFLGQSLAGTKTLTAPDNPYEFTDARGIKYVYVGRGTQSGLLLVDKAEVVGSLIIQGFKSGDFGIVLPTATPPTLTDIFGTPNSDNTASSQPGHAGSLIASAPYQRLYGLAGNDRIHLNQAGAQGYGGLGRDYITNDGGDQKLYGEEGDDVLVASAGRDELYGGSGDDALQGGADEDYLEGNEGDDFIDGGIGADVISGGDGNDFIVGGGTMLPNLTEGQLDNPSAPPIGVLYQNDIAGFQNMFGFLAADGDGDNAIDAGAGNDTVIGGERSDYIDGGDDDDAIVGLSSEDTLFGGLGNDNLHGDGTQGTITFGDVIDLYTLPAYHRGDYLDGGAGDDFLTGDGGADELFGGDDSDVLAACRA